MGAQYFSTAEAKLNVLGLFQAGRACSKPQKSSQALPRRSLEEQWVLRVLRIINGSSESSVPVKSAGSAAAHLTPSTLPVWFFPPSRLLHGTPQVTPPPTLLSLQLGEPTGASQHQPCSGPPTRCSPL